MENKKWSYNKNTDSAILDQNEDVVIPGVDTISEKVVNKLVEMFNEEYSWPKIEAYLEEQTVSEALSPDEQEHIMESIEYWKRVNENGTPATLVAKPDVVASIEVEVMTNETPTALPDTVVPVVTTKKTRAPKGTGTSTGPKKKVSLDTLESSLEDQIKALIEKKELLAILKQTKAPELPENMTPTGRKIMLELQKEYHQLMDKTATLISEM